MKIRVEDFRKFVARKDVKKCSWIRLENNIFSSKSFFGLDPIDKYLFLEILFLASHSNSDTITLNVDLLARMFSVSTKQFLASCEKFEQNFLISKIDDVFCARVSEVPKKEILKAPKEPKAPKASRAPKPQPKTRAIWEAYKEAKFKRYGVDPLNNAKSRGILSKLIDYMGEASAIELVRFYFNHPMSKYATNGHPLSLLILDCDWLYTQMKKERPVTDLGVREYLNNQKQQDLAQGMEDFLKRKRGNLEY